MLEKKLQPKQNMTDNRKTSVCRTKRYFVFSPLTNPKNQETLKKPGRREEQRAEDTVKDAGRGEEQRTGDFDGLWK